jgi:mono/diheme cytochrome c family protein
MLVQSKVLPYGEAPVLPHGMGMQLPPDGTMPVTAVAGQPLVRTGMARGAYAEMIPIAVDRSKIEDGRRHFETFCAACHGIEGDGVSVVADKMTLRKPPSLLAKYIRAYPPGRVFQAIREGYGMMPSYAAQLTVDDSWFVVAYVQALQLSRSAPVGDLPPDVRAELAKEAP